MSRIVVTLHPNPLFIAFTLSDRLFNQERYAHSRENKPIGKEKELLSLLNNCTIGVRNAEAVKNQLNVELTEGMLPSEVVPPIITALKHFVNEHDYNPVICCNDKRDDPTKVTSIGVEYVSN